jgi:DNA invertase Pin-like site-specific DNA recombinase
MMATVAAKDASFRSVTRGRHDHGAGRLMLPVLGGMAECERELIRARTRQGARR